MDCSRDPELYFWNFKSMKYHELQKIAKGAGIKANQKIDKLVKLLTEYYAKNDPSQNSAFNNLSQTEVQQSIVERNVTAPRDDCDAKEIMSPVSHIGTRKRRRTFELDEPTLSPAVTPSHDKYPRKASVKSDLTLSPDITSSHCKTQNTNLDSENILDPFDKITTPAITAMSSPVTDIKRTTRSSSSPGIKAMVASMDGNASSSDRKANLLSALDKKIKDKVASTPSKEEQPSQIPRFMAFLAQKKKAVEKTTKPLTPGSKDWRKIHEKNFSKFDSIDVYLTKKTQRMENMSSNKLSKTPSESTKRTPKTATKAPNRTTKTPSKISVTTNSKTPTKVPNVSRLVDGAKQIPVKVFVPTITSTKSMSLNFAGGNNKTPKSAVQKAAVSTTKSTPYRFTGNSSSLNSTQVSTKKTFDIKASLSKPLSWKPHTGKLQPLDFNSKSSIEPKLKTSVAKPQISKPQHAKPQVSKPAARLAVTSKLNTRPSHSKDSRRVQQIDRRENQKYMDMMKRRGLV